MRLGMTLYPTRRSSWNLDHYLANPRARDTGAYLVQEICRVTASGSQDAVLYGGNSVRHQRLEVFINTNRPIQTRENVEQKTP